MEYDNIEIYNQQDSSLVTGENNDKSIDRDSTNWSGQMNTSFKISTNSRMQIIANYRTPSISAQGEPKAMFLPMSLIVTIC